jgi:hypothetical protein
MMAHANVPHKIKYKLFCKAYKTSALLDGFVIVTCNDIEDTRYVHWGSKNQNFMNSLCVWGEAGTVKIKTKMTPNLDDQGIQCMFVRYALGHTGDTYRMWDPKTGGVHVSHDVIWLRQMFYKAKTSTNYIEANTELAQGIHTTIEADEDEESSSTSSNESSEIEEENDIVNEDEDTPQDIPEDDQPDEPEEPPVTRTRSGQTIQQPRHFVEDISAGVFETLTKAGKGYYQRLEEMGCISLGLVGAGLGGSFQDTHELHVMKYDQAMNSKDKKLWVKAVDKEHGCMEKYKDSQEEHLTQERQGFVIYLGNEEESEWSLLCKSNSKRL